MESTLAKRLYRILKNALAHPNYVPGIKRYWSNKLEVPEDFIDRLLEVASACSCAEEFQEEFNRLMEELRSKEQVKTSSLSDEELDLVMLAYTCMEDRGWNTVSVERLITCMNRIGGYSGNPWYNNRILLYRYLLRLVEKGLFEKKNYGKEVFFKPTEAFWNVAKDEIGL